MTATMNGARKMIEVRNPATGEVVGAVPDRTAQVPVLVAKARAAQVGWAERSFAERAKALRAARRWIVDHRAEIVASTMAETGKTYEDALVNEIFGLADAFRFWERNAEKYLREERVGAWNPLVLSRTFTVRRRPLGVVGVIAPWNYPLILGLGDASPALMAGNAVVIKPSEVTPLTTELVVHGMHEAGVPEDVVQVVTGAGKAGAALVDHVDMVAFTGSTRTGRKVGTRAAERLIPCSLELGGKDPMIVCADADLERAANAAATFGLLNSGQICMSIERIYVEDQVHDEFVNKLVDAVAALRQRGGSDPGQADVGAMTFPPQLEIVERHVADAVAKGATVRIGGRRGDGPGLYYEPTVLVDVNHDMACMREETFGPTLPVMRVSDVDEAVRLANDSVYGLASSVFTKDRGKGQAIARRLRAGSTTVNDGLVQLFNRGVPFGGSRESGLGSRHAREGITKYTEPHTVMTSWLPLKKDLGWFPNTKLVTTLIDRLLPIYYRR